MITIKARRKEKRREEEEEERKKGEERRKGSLERKEIGDGNVRVGNHN